MSSIFSTSNGTRSVGNGTGSIGLKLLEEALSHASNHSKGTRSLVNIIVILLLTLPSFAQNQTIEAEMDGMGYLKKRIKQIDEFIERFNDTLQPIENLIDDNYGIKDTLAHQQFLAEAQQSQLNFYDTTWCAQLNVEVKYKGQKHQANLYLNVESYPHDQSSKWVISGVEANFLSLETECVDSATLIPPSANGTNFIALKKVWQNQPNIAAYSKSSFTPDYLSIFLFLIKNGELALESIKQQRYYFRQVKGFVFQCEYLNRSSSNSGWLITAIEPKTKHQAFINQP